MVIAKVRQVNACGIFCWREFPDVNTKEEWFNIHSEFWELMCFENGTPN